MLIPIRSSLAPSTCAAPVRGTPRARPVTSATLVATRSAGRMRRLLSRILLGAALLAPFAAASAQQATDLSGDDGRPVSLEELEARVAEQRAKLAKVMENRSETEARAEDVEARLAERETRMEEMRDELAELCREREKIVSGTLDECLATLED